MSVKVQSFLLLAGQTRSFSVCVSDWAGGWGGGLL